VLPEGGVQLQQLLRLGAVSDWVMLITPAEPGLERVPGAKVKRGLRPLFLLVQIHYFYSDHPAPMPVIH